jgi:hypothetical protein
LCVTIFRVCDAHRSFRFANEKSIFADEKSIFANEKSMFRVSRQHGHRATSQSQDEPNGPFLIPTQLCTTTTPPYYLSYLAPTSPPQLLLLLMSSCCGGDIYASLHFPHDTVAHHWNYVDNQHYGFAFASRRRHTIARFRVASPFCVCVCVSRVRVHVESSESVFAKESIFQQRTFTFFMKKRFL